MAIRLASLTSLFLQAINSSLAPKLSESYNNKDFSKLKLLAQSGSKYALLLSLPLIGIYLIWPQEILSVFGKEFVAGAACLMILTFGQFINASSGSVGFLLQMTNYEKIFRNIILGTLVLNIVLSLILVQIFGKEGVATASMISMVVWNITSVIVAKKKLNIFTIYIPLLSK